MISRYLYVCHTQFGAFCFLIGGMGLAFHEIEKKIKYKRLSEKVRKILVFFINEGRVVDTIDVLRSSVMTGGISSTFEATMDDWMLPNDPREQDDLC